MKRAIVVVLVSVLVVLGLLLGYGGVVKGSGNLTTEEFDYGDFNRVEVGSTFEVEVVQSASYSVSVTADDNLFDYILVSKQGMTLKIQLRTASYIATTQRAKITMPQLRGLELSGATRGTVSGFSTQENVELEVSGASSLDLLEISTSDVKGEQGYR